VSGVGKARLLGFLAGAAVVVLALSPLCASAASAKSLQLKLEGKTLAVGGEALLVAGYSLGPCYWEEQEFKVSVNGSKADKLVKAAGANGLVEGCVGGAKAVEITSARKMIVKLAPLRIHVAGGCVYEFKEISSTYTQTNWGPEIEGTTAGKLDKAESTHSTACAKTQTTIFDVALSGVETALVS
jgi:hypothetical protein